MEHLSPGFYLILTDLIICSSTHVIFHLHDVLLDSLHDVDIDSLTLDQIPYAPESFLINLFENWNLESQIIDLCLGIHSRHY